MNYLPNGTVLPFGLMGVSDDAGMAAFNKTYKNTALRMGVIIKSYDVSSSANQSKLAPEYDVMVFEQQEDRGSTILTYKNCISAEGMGSIADFFERTLRVKQNASNSNKVLNTKGQNGAVVLILCLDGVTEKGVIVGSITHPDRKSTLTGDEKHLEGEFNGVNIKVMDDGSAQFTFKGATDNNGKIISDQGPTVVSVGNDGSFQVMHKTITLRLDKGGVVTLQAQGDINVNSSGNVSVKSSGNATVNAGGDCDITSSGKTVVKASEVDVQGESGMVLTTVTDPVVDTIFGEPTKGVPTFKAGQ